MKWCEHCRDSYPTDHYDDEGDHKTGAAYGYFGALLGVVEAARAVAAGEELSAEELSALSAALKEFDADYP